MSIFNKIIIAGSFLATLAFIPINLSAADAASMQQQPQEMHQQSQQMHQQVQQQPQHMSGNHSYKMKGGGYHYSPSYSSGSYSACNSCDPCKPCDPCDSGCYVAPSCNPCYTPCYAPSYSRSSCSSCSPCCGSLFGW